MIRWQPGYVFPPVFYPPHPPLDLISALFLGAIAIVAFAVTRRRPANGVATLIACTPFAFAHYVGSTSITVGKMALIGVIAALAVSHCRLDELRDRRSIRIALALCLVIATLALSGIAAERTDVVAREVGKWLEYLATFVAATVAFASDPDDRPVWRAVCCVTGVVAVLGLLQEFIGAPAGVFIHGHPVPRIAGPLEGPNQYSAWLGMMLPLLLARILVHRDGLLVAVAAMAAVADTLTLSRSGIIAAIVGCTVAVIASRPPRVVGRRFAVGAVLVLAIVVVAAISAGFEARFFSFAEVPQPDHLGTRGQLWKAALDLWRTSPIVGIGAGNFEFALGRVGLPQVHTHANSLYLQSLAETGVLGLGAMLYFVYVSIDTFAGRLVRRPLVIGALAAGIVMALHQVFDYLVFFPKVGSLWFLIVAVGVVESIAAQHEWRDLDIAV